MVDVPQHDQSNDGDLARLLAETNRRQWQAADPLASVWVSANAGTGKTHVLTNRVLRLLLAGTPPEKILCLTYTKAAAALMSRRVFDKLAAWVVMDDAHLGDALGGLFDRPARAEEIGIARTLFAKAIETPGGLKVQTIHAFCERLLQRFPLEAGISPNFKVLDEPGQRALIRQATDTVLTRATREHAIYGPLGQALLRAVAHASDDRFDLVLTEVLRHRAAVLQLADVSDGDNDTPYAVMGKKLRRRFGVRPGVSDADLLAESAGVVNDETLATAESVLSASSGVTDRKMSRLVRAVRSGTDPHVRAGHLADYFLTGGGTPRKDLAVKAVREASPGLFDELAKAQDRFATLNDERQGLRVVEGTVALMTVAREIILRYERFKGQRAELDYDDLIARTGALLASSADAAWVLYKLDNGLDHILVDEAQDTAPAQWDVVARLSEEFFSGAGARETVRTIFAVGDEKQSIYGFQGARPERFAGMGRHFSARARDAAQAFRSIPLTLSFRTVSPVLGAVDDVFRDSGRVPGLSAAGDAIRHEAIRIGQAGSVELWPLEVPDGDDGADVWDVSADANSVAPTDRLARRIARQVRHWIDSRTLLESKARPITAGDVLILLRRRLPLAPAIIRALKAEGLPVAGADRIRVLEQLAVMDLMALTDFLLLPEDDLALATVLKSPLIGLSEGALYEIAYGRKGTLWNSFLGAAGHNPDYAAAMDLLLRWRRQADYAPPFEFFSLVLERDGARKRLVERLGPEASDALDEFLNLAIRFDEEHPPSMQGFATWLQASSPDIKRDMEDDRTQVRVMTVHGAKGLEAPIVILPDTCFSPMQPGGGPLIVKATAASAPASGTGLPPDGAEDRAPLIWAMKGASRAAVVKTEQTANRQTEAEEINRLLYVAMTRAEDHLIVAGATNKETGKVPANCWYELIAEGLRDRLSDETDAFGGPVRRWSTAQTAAVEAQVPPGPTSVPSPPRPAWTNARATPEPNRVIPVAPSRIVPLDSDEAAAAIEGAADGIAPLDLSADTRFLRGVLTHALLQALPDMDPKTRRPAAKRYVEARGSALNAGVRRQIVTETLALLDNPEFSWLFGPLSQPEVPIVAEIAAPDGSGRLLRLNGQIDRLAMRDEKIVIVDYKTNRPPPEDLVAVPPAYLVQMAAYRLGVRAMFPGKSVSAVIIWTCGARAMAVPDALLDAQSGAICGRTAA